MNSIGVPGEPEVRRAVGFRNAALILLATAVTVGLLLHFDLFRLDGEAVAERLRGAGPFGPVALVLLLVVQSVVAPLPSQPLLMATGFIYGTTAGFAVGWVGVAAGACACFFIARLLGRPFVERFVSSERLAAVDAYVAGRGLGTTFAAVLSLRLFAHISFDAVSYACGLTRFPFGWFLVATAIGEVPKVFLFTYLGAGFGEAPGWMRAAMFAGVLATAGIWVFVLRRHGARQKAEPRPSTRCP